MALTSPLSLQISFNSHIINRDIPHRSNTDSNFRSPKRKAKPQRIRTTASLQETSTENPISEITTIQSHVSQTFNNSQYKHVQLKEALSILDAINQQNIPLQNSHAYASLLQACIDMKALEQGKQIHAQMLKTAVHQNLYLQTKLLTMYAKFGNIEEARLVFDGMPKHNMFAWSTMIRECTHFGFVEESIEFYNRMRYAGFQPDVFVFVNVLKACATIREMQKGKGIHCCVIRIGLERDVVLEDALVDMYSRCGVIEDARQMFDKMPQKDVVSYNVMIAGYAYNGLSDEALKVFSEMRLEKMKPNLKSWNTLIEAYSNAGNCDEAFNLLRQMQLSRVVPNVVSWNTVIGGYAQKGHSHEALRLFWQMLMAGEKPGADTIVSVLSVCPYIKDPQHGKDVHGYIIRNGFLSDSFVGNALVDMYVKMGSLEDAYQVFDELFDRGEALFNSMIAGYTLNEHAD